MQTPKACKQSAPLPCVELIPVQVNSSCAVNRHSQRAALCPGRLVSALMFTPREHSCLRVEWLDDHIARSRSVTSAHVQTTREQLQQQRFYFYRLTQIKCPQEQTKNNRTKIVIQEIKKKDYEKRKELQ